MGFGDAPMEIAEPSMAVGEHPTSFGEAPIGANVHGRTAQSSQPVAGSWAGKKTLSPAPTSS